MPGVPGISRGRVAAQSVLTSWTVQGSLSLPGELENWTRDTWGASPMLKNQGLWNLCAHLPVHTHTPLGTHYTLAS